MKKNLSFANRKMIGLLLITIALFLVACAAAGGSEPAAGDVSGQETVVPNETPAQVPGFEQLVGIIWVLQQMGTLEPALEAQPTLEFSPESINGNTGCNNYFGSFSVDGGKISFSQVGMTEMWCEGRMEQENAYVTMLQSAHSFSLDEDQLVLHTNDGDMIYIVASDRELEGTEWVLGGIASSGAIVHTWIDEEIIMQLSDGTISGNSGCNGYSGGYTVMENELTIGDLFSTLMACAEGERNDREAEFLAALARVAAFEIERDTLNLFDEQGELVLNFMAGGDREEMETSPEEITLFVGPERVPCEGVAPQECYQIKRESGDEWELFYDEIQGFTWEPGFEYELRVQVETVPNAPADASSLQYQLLDLVAQTPVTE